MMMEYCARARNNLEVEWRSNGEEKKKQQHLFRFDCLYSFGFAVLRAFVCERAKPISQQMNSKKKKIIERIHRNKIQWIKIVNRFNGAAFMW